MSKPIKLFYSRRKNLKLNFGDDISPILFEHLTGRKVIHSDVMNCDFTAIGSILDRVCAHRFKKIMNFRLNPINVWGSGFIKPGKLKSKFLLNVLALRGELSKQRLNYKKNLVLGDPGLLFNRIHYSSKKEFSWGIVPHYVDSESPVIQELLNQTKNSLMIRLDQDPIEVLKQIASCEKIASSSLHGLVTADSYQIPNWRLNITGLLDGGDFKFEDYCSSVGRPDLTCVDFNPNFNLDRLCELTDEDFGYFKEIDSKSKLLERSLLGAF